MNQCSVQPKRRRCESLWRVLNGSLWWEMAEVVINEPILLAIEIQQIWYCNSLLRVLLSGSALLRNGRGCQKWINATGGLNSYSRERGRGMGVVERLWATQAILSSWLSHVWVNSTGGISLWLPRYDNCCTRFTAPANFINRSAA